ncbi:MAG: YgjV family protein [Vallitaleaceae bacterium]|jgi:hypothetical protein|nr:YgjV family protein [Vallitaleaceae bacterium]
MLEWLGYAASLIILISLLMSSIIKLRFINLFGSILFAIYGFMIGSIPVAVMNIGIVVINLFYLYKIYGSKEYFQLLQVDSNSKYLKAFTEFYKTDLEKFFNKSDFSIGADSFGLYILRDMIPAGIFIARKIDDKTLHVELDYAVAAYRDFKLGNYLYETKKSFFTDLGYELMTATAYNAEHAVYLQKMGFIKSEDQLFKKILV